MLSRLSAPLIRAGAALLLAGLAACVRDPAATSSGTLVDDFGDTLAWSAAPARRIVSLNPTTTALLYAIGAGGRLVGRTTYDRSPDAVRALPDLGPGIRPNVETVLGVSPDLVVLYASNDNRDAARRFRVAGVRTASFRVDRLRDFERVTLTLGRLTGDSAAARSTVDSVRTTLDRVRAATAGLARPTVFWPVWVSPLLAIGGGSYLDELLTIAGARNIYGELPQPSPSVSFEDLVQRDPDIILASAAWRERMRTEPRWASLRAVRTDRVLLFDTTIVNGPAAGVGASAAGLAALLHPGLRVP